jgi:demethylmenaquinone methyltransferase/2-methoxy-6-polyprenyl-1,4-benzoquinol methylase
MYLSDVSVSRFRAETKGTTAMIDPYRNSSLSHKEQVRSMFGSIAGTYDLLNHLFSLGIDRRWRRKAIALLEREKPSEILDVAAGTGDFAIAAARIHPDRIVGIDITEKMLRIGREKVNRLGLSRLIELMRSDAENIPFPDDSYDAVIVAFGVRNFSDLERGLLEMHRVLRKGGTLLILELSRMRLFPLGALYRIYFFGLMPLVGLLVSKDSAAYRYLPRSVDSFPKKEEFLAMLRAAGFSDPKAFPLSLGIAVIYTARK